MAEDDALPTMPAQQQSISELSPVLKTRTPRRQDPYGQKARKNFKTYSMSPGRRPIFREPSRRVR